MMPPEENKQDIMLGPWFKAAKDGNQRAAYFLFELAANMVEKGSILPPRLRTFFTKVVKDPALYADIMISDTKKPRGRPSIDSNTIFDLIGLEQSIPFGYRKSERNALAIHYLLSQGHTLNVAGSAEEESAVEIVSILTGRGMRSLQSDYAKHKETILRESLTADSAKLAYQELLYLAKLRRRKT